jgi:DNA ligase-1
MFGLCHVYRGEINWEEGWAIEPKLDGVRCQMTISGRKITFTSRNDKKSFYNTEYIENNMPYLSGSEKVVLDGELYAGAWNSTISIIHSQKKVNNSDQLKFYVFDILNEQSYLDRKKTLNNFKSSRVIQVPYKIVTNEEEAKKEHIKHLKEGYEGSVLKKISSLYPKGRTKDWLKWKETESVDLQITGFVEGEGKHVGRLGHVVCDYKGKPVGVGTGFDDLEREEIWNNQKKYIGKVIEITYQEETKDGSLRFPTFIRLREDK